LTHFPVATAPAALGRAAWPRCGGGEPALQQPMRGIKIVAANDTKRPQHGCLPSGQQGKTGCPSRRAGVSRRSCRAVDVAARRAASNGAATTGYAEVPGGSRAAVPRRSRGPSFRAALAARAGDEVGGYVFDITILSRVCKRGYQQIYQHHLASRLAGSITWLAVASSIPVKF